ncbi:MAG: hypothetical protein ABI691_14940 [Ginsengibacter sp.]
MKNILIFATIAGIAIVIAYYLIIEDGDESIDVPALNADEIL